MTLLGIMMALITSNVAFSFCCFLLFGLGVCACVGYEQINEHVCVLYVMYVSLADCGSGIGRVTKNLLLRYFNEASNFASS